MTEMKVKQRSPEWFDARKKVTLTASMFGDALGLGKGRVLDYLLSLVSDDPCYTAESPQKSFPLQHGIDMEIIMREAYQLLTGFHTRESGFWIPGSLDTMMSGIIGVTPDDLVVSSPNQKQEKIYGLVEYKAPVHKLYNPESTIKGIPRHYMAQIQGQMSVTGTPWCDFMAVCLKTREIMLKRVFYSPKYWYHAASRLKQFSLALKMAQEEKSRSGYITSFALADLSQCKEIQIKSQTPILGEYEIKVQNMIECNNNGSYKGSTGKWLTFDFLVGSPTRLSPELQHYADRLLQDVDKKILQCH